MLPEDMHVTRLKITTRLRKYIQENIAMWYRYFKHTLGHDIENGDLRVVYSCRKSTGFGIAAAFNTGRRDNTRLSFLNESPSAYSSRCPYRWTHIGSAETKAFSSAQANVEFSSTGPVRNQCLFIETIDTRLSAETWSSAELDTMMYRMPSSNVRDRERRHGKDKNTGQSSTSESESTSFSSFAPSHKVFVGSIMFYNTNSKYFQHIFHPSIILHYILEVIVGDIYIYIFL